MRWSQVDLIARTIRLEGGETKNDEARIIPLLVEELYQTVAMQRTIRDREHPECRWVLFWEDGRRILDFRKSREASAKTAGLGNADAEKADKLFHDLRRTGVRNLIRSGVPEKVAMLISGHKTRAVFDRYHIVDERDTQDAMRKLDAYAKARAEAECAKGAIGADSGNWHTIGTQTEAPQ